MATPQESNVLHRLIYVGKCEKILLFETRRPIPLLFGMSHHLVDLYQVCSSYSPWVKIAPPLGSIVSLFYIGLYRENVKKSSCLKPEGQDYCYMVLRIT